MQGRHIGMLGAGGLLALLAVFGLVVLQLPSREQLAAELQQRLGVPVTVGALRWQLLPQPAVVLQALATGQSPAISAKTITLYPRLAPLLRRRLQLDRVEVTGAVVPQLSLRALDQRATKAMADPGATPLARLVLRDLTWVSPRGIALVYDGEVDFDPAWRPRTAQLRRPGVQPATALTLARLGQDDRWTVQVHVGGGTAHGEVQLRVRDKGQLQLSGQLQPRAIEVESALAAFKRRSIVAGQASGQTTLSASGETLGELAQSLHTTTRFNLGRATLLRFDLDKAIRSFGKEHGGQTALDAVSGQLDTQNTAQGMVVSCTGLQARSGTFSASGHARIANRQIQAEFAVDLVDGVVGVPLQLSGPLENVKVSVPQGAVAGAVLGTAVLPGVGTAIGARLGAALGHIFKPEPPPPKRGTAPARPAPP